MTVHEIICIGCPMGCNLSVEMSDGKVEKVSGNTCRRGADYARKELTNPTRIVTSTVRVQNREMVSVKTSADVPKEKIFDCVKELKGICLTAPVRMGQVIIEDVAGTGVSVIATKEIL